MIKKSLAAVAVVAGLLAAFVATRPGEYKVVRSASVFAPATVPYGHVASFHRWAAWSPWGSLDGRGVAYGGPAAGVGATYRWTGSERLGDGRMTIVAARPAAQLVLSLESARRKGEESTVTFAFAPEGAATRVTVELAEKVSFVGKAMRLFERQGRSEPDLEAGLAALKGIAECEAWEAGVGDAVAEAVPAGALSAVVEHPTR